MIRPIDGRSFVSRRRGAAVHVARRSGSLSGGVSGLDVPLGHRAIGTVYDPAVEHLSHYVSSIIPQRSDAFVFIDQTRAADPLFPIVDAARASRRA